MNRRLHRFVLAAALVLAPAAAFAQQATAAQVDRLMEVMRARETVDAILPQVELSQQQMVAQLTAGQQLDDAQKAQIDQQIRRTNARIREALSWERLQPLYRDIYTQTFTGEDVDAMIAFYSSEAGQRLLDKMPQLMQNTMAAVQRLVMPMLQEMEQDLREAASKK